MWLQLYTFIIVAFATAVTSNRFIIEYISTQTNTGANRIAADPNIQILRTLESDIFSGASILAEQHSLDSLSSIPGIANVWPLNTVKLPTPPSNAANLSADDVAAPLYDIHGATGVDKLHAAGVLGEGATVAIVDTGVWYPHPALGGGIGPGFKIEGGYDLVGNGFWPIFGNITPDSDPLDQQGHGTHVAGIVAGQSDKFTGVAPNAKLRCYKVFDWIDSTTEDLLIAAFLMAYNDGVDIITSSIGSSSGFADGPWALVASRLVQQGLVVTIAANNDGISGPFFATNGGSGKDVIAVASVAASEVPAQGFDAVFSVNGAISKRPLAYYDSPDTGDFPPAIVNWPVVALSYDTTNPADACNPLPKNTTDLSKVVSLVRRGTCNFSVKQANLEAFGAKYILVYNNENPLVNPSTNDTKSILGIITADDGVAIINTLKAGGSVNVTFSNDPPIIGVPNLYSGLPSPFTSWGGLYDLSLKPDVAAPGQRIFSTWLSDQYAVLDGTSMATPYVAGVAALYVGAYGGRAKNGPGFGAMLSRRIIASGATVPWSNGSLDSFGFNAPVAQVGTGLINAVKVLNYTTTLSVHKIELNDTRNFKGHQDFDITNNGLQPVIYSFFAEYGATVQVLEPFNATNYPSPRLVDFAEVTPTQYRLGIVTPNKLSVPAGQTRTARVTFLVPDANSNLPLYGGKILVSGNNGEELSVPFMGLAADLKKAMTPIFETNYPDSASGPLSNPVSFRNHSTYTFNTSARVLDFPRLFTNLKWGTKQLRWDIYEANWHESSWCYPPVVGNAGYIGSATDSLNTDSGPQPFPIPDVERNSQDEPQQVINQWGWLGDLAGGGLLANGVFTMRVAALVPFGDPSRSSDWSIWLIDGKLPQFTVARPANTSSTP